MLRFEAGDFDGFLKDATAMKQLARHLEKSPTVIEQLVGVAIEALASQSIAGAADSGKLTPSQGAAIESMLAALPAHTAIAAEWERFILLDSTIELATGHFGGVVGLVVGEHTMDSMFPPADMKSVDWDLVLKREVAFTDEQAKLADAPDVAAIREKGAEIQKESDAWSKEAGSPPDLHHKENEPRDAYSERVARGLMSILSPELARAVVLDRKAVMANDMVQMLLAAADMKAKTGKWPEKGEDLVPGEMKELPRDIYSEGGKGTAAVKYLLTQAGPRVYSVGENGRDDGGMAGDGKDDFALGGFVRAPAENVDAALP